MTISDVNVLKGAVKDAVLSWGGKKIDELFKNRAAVAVMAKRGLYNVVAGNDAKINAYVDRAFLFLADERGSIDSDGVVDMVCDLLAQMEKKSYPMGPVTAVIGAGEVALELPHSFLLDMLTGGMGVIRLNKDDFLELKNYF